MQEIKKSVKNKDKSFYNSLKKCWTRRKDKYQIKYLVIDRQTPTLYAKIMKMRNNAELKIQDSVEFVRTKPINILMHDINK